MFKFSFNEIADIVLSFFVISIAFSMLYSKADVNHAINILPIVMVGAGFGFIFHELAHKFAALHYNYQAEFKKWIPGLIFSLISPMIGFMFAAPGAVHIYGSYMSDKINGIISIVGPITNIILSLIFLILGSYILTNPVLFNLGENQILLQMCILGFSINAWLSLFNLIPISVLDGAKVFRWDPIIWLITAGIAGGLVYISMTSGNTIFIFIAKLISGGS
ncbi:MAG: site-2 protease family protein [Methanobrevibacter sp.]|jgi:Zn-dependent protease|nr:site-2 protease family protein [Candidatus Methanovirga basalitermitum]